MWGSVTVTIYRMTVVLGLKWSWGKYERVLKMENVSHILLYCSRFVCKSLANSRSGNTYENYQQWKNSKICAVVSIQWRVSSRIEESLWHTRLDTTKQFYENWGSHTTGLHCPDSQQCWASLWTLNKTKGKRGNWAVWLQLQKERPFVITYTWSLQSCHQFWKTHLCVYATSGISGAFCLLSQRGTQSSIIPPDIQALMLE